LESANGGLICLTGGDEGPLAHALRANGREGARKCLEQLCAIFGSENVYVELQRHFSIEEERRNQIAIELARSLHLPLLATNGVCQRSLRSAKFSMFSPACGITACSLMRAPAFLQRRTLLEISFADERSICGFARSDRQHHRTCCSPAIHAEGPWLHFSHLSHSDLQSQIDFLRDRTREGWFTATARKTSAPHQIQRELAIIEKLDLAGYFLIVWDIVRFCRDKNILVQGRGSAANSAVCYSLGITAVDPVGMNLLFERFLSEERGEWPDIDLDLPSGDQRERAIQYVYERYGKNRRCNDRM
jgi:error-prone DNA polymerase